MNAGNPGVENCIEEPDILIKGWFGIMIINLYSMI